MKSQLGHYDILSELGRGGMGVVYKGYEPSLNRYVAIKVFAESLAHDASVKERFLREARSMAALNDPHVIQIHFIGEDAGQTYFVMEFVDGESLGSLLTREHALNPEQTAKIIHQTAQGLATAHDKGVIHRDIKPGNLMITSKGGVKIADFGIALKTQDFGRKLTSTGEFVGTPGYLSPEVCLNKPVDQRSDIFSLGVVMFECLAGRMPFKDDSPLGLMLEVVTAEIPDVRALNADVDVELSRILGRMIAKDPADRYQNCHELAADLEKHPLVAKGGAIPLQTQQSSAAKTLIGANTPTSAQRALPSTTPTPLPVPGAMIAAERSTTPRMPLAANRPVASDAKAQPAGRRRAAYLGIAAAAVLAATTAGWAFRDRLHFVPASQAGRGARPVAGAPAGIAANSVTGGEANGTRANAAANATANTGNTDHALPMTPAATTNAPQDDGVPADALWLADVPDGLLEPGGVEAFDRMTGNAAASNAGWTSPRPYPYSLPVGPTPGSYYAPAWHFGIGVALGAAIWPNYYVYPQTVYVVPLRQPVVVASRAVATTGVAPTPALAARNAIPPPNPARPIVAAPAAVVEARPAPVNLATREVPAGNAMPRPQSAAPRPLPMQPLRSNAAEIASPAQQVQQAQQAQRQRRNEALAAQREQRREAVVAQQNARRAAQAEAKAKAEEAARERAARANAARERKAAKPHPRQPAR